MKTCLDSDNRFMKLEVEGSYPDFYTIPQLDYWNRCNPMKSLAIELFMNNLRKHCWSPINKGINEYVKCTGGIYRHGNVVTIECQFD